MAPYTSPDVLPQCRTADEVALAGGSNLIMNEELTGRGDRVRVRNAVHNIGVDLMVLLSLALHGFLHSLPQYTWSNHHLCSKLYLSLVHYT